MRGNPVPAALFEKRLMTTLTRDDRTAAILWAVEQRTILLEQLEAVENLDRRKLMLGELVRMLRYDAARVTP